MVSDSILEIGLNNLVGTQKAFINFTTQNILERVPLDLPRDRVVIEIPENIRIDLQILNSLNEMSQKGYLIALNNCDLTPEYQKLLAFADIIKLDVLKIGESRIREIVEQLKFYDIKILAFKIETHEQYKYLLELGCDYFQGFFCHKPNLVAGKRIGVHQMKVLILLTMINNPQIEFDVLVKEISQDLSLCHKILCYINSAFYPTSALKIKSISHAIAYLGLNELRRWVNIVMLSSLSHKKPNFVIFNSLVRGRMCELLSKLISENAMTYNEFFLIGILSSLDCLLDISLEDALAQLPLSEHIIDAILYRQGFGGAILNCVLNYEVGNYDETGFRNLSWSTISEIYIESLNWVTAIYDTQNLK